MTASQIEMRRAALRLLRNAGIAAGAGLLALGGMFPAAWVMQMALRADDAWWGFPVAMSAIVIWFAIAAALFAGAVILVEILEAEDAS